MVFLYSLLLHFYLRLLQLLQINDRLSVYREMQRHSLFDLRLKFSAVNKTVFNSTPNNQVKLSRSQRYSMHSVRYNLRL